MAFILSPLLSSTVSISPLSISKSLRGNFFYGKISPSRSLVFRPPLPQPWRNHCRARNYSSGIPSASYFSAAGDLDLDFEEEDKEGSPWEGALVYKRDSSVTHLEFCTTLERLGLGKLSSELSMSRASAMGIRLPSSRFPLLGGTPVLVSIDITRKKRKLKLDGILRTVIVLGCNRCGGPAAENVFSNFVILLTEDPIKEEEEEAINLGTIFGSDKSGTLDDDEGSIDPEDRLFFPPEEKSIDISKNIRDLIHLEITINPVCDPNCQGLCLKCGTNLNKSRCRCEEEAEKFKEFGPLGSLKQQMQGI